MFIECNVNPKQLKVGDCVVRALAKASGLSWDEVYLDLCNLGMDMFRMPSDKKVYETWLEQNGFYKQKMPRHEDRTKYSVYELAEELNEIYEGYAVVAIANHMTVVGYGNIYDLWDCGNYKVGNFYVRL